jgi:hypothetical protein
MFSEPTKISPKIISENNFPIFFLKKNLQASVLYNAAAKPQIFSP